MSLPMYPYTNMSDTNLDWLIADNKRVHVEMKETTEYINESREHIDNQLKNAQESEENASESAENASASAESASNDANYISTHANQIDLNSQNIANEITTRENADISLRQAIDALVSPSGQSVVVDSSLSISGAAADAKMTGLFAKYGLNYGVITSFSQILTQGLYLYNKNTFTDEIPSSFTQYGYILCLYVNNASTEKFYIIFDENLNAIIRYNDRTNEITTPHKYLGTLDDFNNAKDGLYAVSPSTLNIPSTYGGYGWLEVTIYDNGTKTATLYRDNGSIVQYANNIWHLHFRNAKWYLIGDSLTEINRTASRNWTKLFEADGGDIVNMGIGGTGFARTENRYINRINDLPTGYCNIGVSASFNDMSAGVDIGEPTDTGTTSVCGYINQFFDALLQHNPEATIICYAMPPWDVYHYGVARSDQYINNLEIICKTRGIPFDRSMYDNSDMRPWNAAYRATFYSDGTHPNNYGHIKIWNHLKRFFDANSNIVLSS